MKNPNFKFLFLTFFVLTLFLSCNNDSDNGDTPPDPEPVVVDFGTTPSSSLITSGTVNVITESKVRYHTFNITDKPYTVTMVETKGNVVLLDLGPGAVAGTQLKAYFDAINKPGHVIITHNHSDHYSGAESFTGLTFYAQNEVASQLNGSSKFKGLYSKTVVAVSSSKVIGDLTFKFDKVSNAETGENGYVYNEEHKALFAGDLIYNLCHPFLREYTPKLGGDEIDNWIAGLNLLKSNYAGYNHVFVGHNGSRTDIGTVIDENINYLQKAKAIIKGTQNITSGVKATTNQDVIDELQLLYPTYKEAGLLWSLPGAIGANDSGADWF